MKVLVTGHRGFIGKNLVSYIQDNTDWQVIGWEWNDSTFPLLEGQKYDWVIHLGAISSTTERDVNKVMRQNYEFSQRLIRECSWNGINFQYSSSASVYGLNQKFKEDAPKDPKSAYAWSKYLFDRYLESQTSYFNASTYSKILVQGFRYFNVYGEQEEHKGNMASPVTKFLSQAKEQGRITVFEKSEVYKRDFVWVGDVCRAHVEFIKRVDQNGIWNIGTGGTVSFADIAKAISTKTNVPVVEIPMPIELKGQYQEYTCACLTNFERVLPNFKWLSVLDWIQK